MSLTPPGVLWLRRDYGADQGNGTDVDGSTWFEQNGTRNREMGVSRIERRQGEEFREDKVVLFEGKQMDVQMQSG